MGFGAASSGAAFGAAFAGATGLQQAKTAVLDYRKVTDLLHSWEERMHKQAQQFETFTSQVLQVDTEIIANVRKVKALHSEHAQLLSRHQAAEDSIKQTLQQQDALGQLLTSLQ